ncbi:MAG: P-type ATPase, translocating [Nitrospira sp.]|jgi:nucleotide-binding universal stress UspA family protein|nr:P-type ATPase, translocating [Nitrospira sp.]
MNIASIAVAIDFSDHARHAADRAAMLAAEQRAQLDLVHVISESSLDRLHNWLGAPADAEARLRDDAERSLSDMVKDIAGKRNIAARALVKTGHVLNQILSSSESADLLVLGAHGRNPLRDLILGTTAERLLGTSKQPVLVTKRPPQALYEQVIVPVDFSAYSAPALRMSRLIAPTARITIVHAFRVPFEGRLRIAGASEESILAYCEEERQEAVKKIKELIRGSDDDASRMSYAVERGHVSRVILAQEEKFSADLIVIGKHGRSMVEEWLLGGVTRHVLAGSKCDVLVVHEGTEVR